MSLVPAYNGGSRQKLFPVPISNCTMSVVIPVEMMPPVRGHRVRTAAIEKTPGMLFNKNSRRAF